jgi:hypothetical protein
MKSAIGCGLFALAAMAFAAQAADPKAAPASGKEKPVKLEPVPGSKVKRVTLVPKAAERLGIQLGKVSEQALVRKQMVGGLVLAASPQASEPGASSGASQGFSGFTQIAASPAAKAPLVKRTDATWLVVTLSPAEWERLAKDKPARVLPLPNQGSDLKEILALPTGIPPVENAKRSMLSVYYTVPGKDNGLAPNRRMRVELQQSGTEGMQKVVPYGAVYYDAKGEPWVYVAMAPLVFERQPVKVERVAGDLAVLTSGPAVGTQIVTVGAALLFGAELFGK